MYEKPVQINAAKGDKTVVLEPHGMTYNLKKGQEMELILYGEEEVDFDLEEEEGQVIVYVNSSSAFKTYIDSEYYDGFDKPFPKMSMGAKKFTNMLFGGPRGTGKELLDKLNSRKDKDNPAKNA